MTLLSRFSAAEAEGLPEPADQRLLDLGLSAWQTALAEAPQDDRTASARAWSETAEGQRLLAAIFGNSPFLSAVAVSEWHCLTRLLDEGCYRLCAEAIVLF